MFVLYTPSSRIAGLEFSNIEIVRHLCNLSYPTGVSRRDRTSCEFVFFLYCISLFYNVVTSYYEVLPSAYLSVGPEEQR